MIDWFVILTPLLVLPIFLLFRFVGCDLLFNLDHLPTYEEIIDDEASLMAFWPLTEEDNAPQAADTKGSFHGLYGEPPPSSGGGSSQAASGKLVRGQPDIIVGPSIDFQGGYVVVPLDPALNTHSFTVEAWVVPGMWEPQRSHAVVTWSEIGSFNELRGFALFAGYHPVDQKVSWSASLSTGATPPVLIKGAPVKVPATKTFLALTYSHVANAATLYVSQSPAGWDTLETATVTNGYVPVQGISLYIGASTNSPQPPPPPPPAPAPPVSIPFLGRIQAVAFYNDALSEATLAKHRGSS